MPPTTTPSRGAGFLTSATPADQIFTREDITDEQRMFAQTAAAFMRQEVLPVQSRLFEHDWGLLRELLRKAATLDLLGVEVPAAYGGLALSKVSGALVGEQFATHASFGASLNVHCGIGTNPLLYFGTPALKAKYLPRLVSGELIAAYALTEPGAGSDARAARTRADLTADGKHYLLTGEKMWITNGGFADVFTVFAKVDGEHFTAFLVERNMGVVSGPEERKLGLDGSSTTALTLDAVAVPVENVLGRIGEGHKVAFNILNIGRVKLGARNMATSRLALRHAARYAVDRRQFGQSIGEFGLIQEKLADMAIRCFVGDAMVFRALGDVDRGLEGLAPEDTAGMLTVIEAFAVECAINKVFTSEALAFVADEAVQIFGGNGFSREFPVEEIYRDARITRIYEGTNEINRLIIATRLLNADVTSADRAVVPEISSEKLFAGERQVLEGTRALTRRLFHLVAATFGAAARQRQEVLARLANLAVEVYAIESAIGRVEKIAAGRGDAGLKAALVEVYVADAVHRIVAAATSSSAAIGDAAADLSEPIRQLQARPPVDTIARRREIARAVLAAGGDLS